MTPAASHLAPLLASVRDDWCTPPEVLDVVRRLGPIGLDPCGNPQSVVGAATTYLNDGKGNGLLDPWAGHGLVYCNPPYGRGDNGPRAWVGKAVSEAAKGVEVVLLVAARPDTRWFQPLFPTGEPGHANALCFWRGRVRFLGASAGAPFPSALAYWGPTLHSHLFADAFRAHGAVWIGA